MGKKSKKVNKKATFMLSFILKVIVYLLVFIVLIKASFFSYTLGYKIVNCQAVAQEPGIDIEVNINDSMDMKTLVEVLENKGVILDKNVAYLQSKFFGFKVVPGNYVLNNSYNSKKILSIINDGTQNLENTEN